MSLLCREYRVLSDHDILGELIQRRHSSQFDLEICNLLHSSSLCFGGIWLGLATLDLSLDGHWRLDIQRTEPVKHIFTVGVGLVRGDQLDGM